MNSLIKFVLGGFLTKVAYDTIVGKSSSSLPKRRVFISHSWNRGSDDYKKLIKKLNNKNIEFYNHSIPVDKAVNETRKRELMKIFYKKIFHCSKVIVLANEGIKKESFVFKEIEIAKKLNKQIIAVKPYKQKTIPSFIRKNATVIIPNNINYIIDNLN